MPNKLLFLSSANLSTNPRLLKELKLAVQEGCEVDFVGFDLDNWSQAIDSELIKSINANFTYLPVTRKYLFQWFVSTMIEKIAGKLNLFCKKSLKINAYAHSKRTYLLNKFLRKSEKKYDLTVAHTLPTLYAAYRLSQKQNIPFSFDIEDYHPGEAVSVSANSETQRRLFLMQNILPKASYITYASPLIGKYSLDLLNNYPENKHQLINNCFSQAEFQFQENNSGKVKFVWFSQNIAAGRGLELVLPALLKFKDKAELHLIGNLYPDFYDNYLSAYSDIVTIHKPRPQTELNRMLSEFDVGLALELKTADFNREICLTNKIWAYFQSGLYILATDTPAQRKFIETHPQAGKISKQNTEDFTENTAFITKNISNIRKNKKDRFRYAQKYAWEKESRKMTEIWNDLTT